MCGDIVVIQLKFEKRPEFPILEDRTSSKGPASLGDLYLTNDVTSRPQTTKEEKWKNPTQSQKFVRGNLSSLPNSYV